MRKRKTICIAALKKQAEGDAKAAKTEGGKFSSLKDFHHGMAFFVIYVCKAELFYLLAPVDETVGYPVLVCLYSSSSTAAAVGSSLLLSPAAALTKIPLWLRIANRSSDTEAFTATRMRGECPTSAALTSSGQCFVIAFDLVYLFSCNMSVVCCGWF